MASCFPYSYNATACRAQNPALRHEISFEMGQMHSDTALHFHANKVGDGGPVHTKAMTSDLWRGSKVPPQPEK